MDIQDKKLNSKLKENLLLLQVGLKGLILVSIIAISLYAVIDFVDPSSVLNNNFLKN